MTAAIESCRENLRRVASSWRLGCDAQANEAFLGVVDELAALLEAGLDPDRAANLTALFPAIVAAQTRGDTITIADLLEHEVDPLLAPAN